MTEKDNILAEEATNEVNEFMGSKEIQNALFQEVKQNPELKKYSVSALAALEQVMGVDFNMNRSTEGIVIIAFLMKKYHESQEQAGDKDWQEF